MRCGAIDANKKAGCTHKVLLGPRSQNMHRMALGRQLEKNFLKSKELEISGISNLNDEDLLSPQFLQTREYDPALYRSNRQ